MKILPLLFVLLILGAECLHLTNNNANKHQRKFHRSQQEHDSNIQIAYTDNDNDIIDINDQDFIEVVASDDGQVVAQKWVSPVDKTPETAWQTLALDSPSFEAFYEQYKALLQVDLDALISERTAKNQECNAYDAEISDLQFSIAKQNDYIQWLSTQIAQNTAKIDKIFAERCEAHQIFIEYYKNAKVTLRLVAFLKEAIQNYSLLQLKQVGNIMTEFMNPALLSNKEAVHSMLTQLKQVDGGSTYDNVGDSLQDPSHTRTSEEVGQGHIDNNREQITVDEFSSAERRVLDNYKAEIYDILDKISAKVQGEINRRQDDEIELNDRVVKFVENMEIENQNLSSEIETARSAIVEFTVNLNVQLYLSETCKGDLQWLDDNIAAQENILLIVVTNTDQIRVQYHAFIASKTYVQPVSVDDGFVSIKIGTKYGAVAAQGSGEDFGNTLHLQYDRATQPSGYCDVDSPEWPISNQSACQGPNSNILWKFDFTFFNPEQSFWVIEFGTDFGRGASVWVDSKFELARTDDLWWSSDWNSGAVFRVQKSWGKGTHSVLVYGSEGCCDGPMAVRFSYNGQAFQSLTKVNVQAAISFKNKGFTSKIDLKTRYGASGAIGSDQVFADQLVSQFYTAPATSGYCDVPNPSWPLNNQSACQGPNSNILFQLEFQFYATQESSWVIEFGTDFGRGAAIWIDGLWSQSIQQDLWWEGNWDSASVFRVTKSFLVGRHSIIVHGSEGCCDGPMHVRFSYNGRDWQSLTQQNVDNTIPAPVQPITSVVESEADKVGNNANITIETKFGAFVANGNGQQFGDNLAYQFDTAVAQQGYCAVSNPSWPLNNQSACQGPNSNILWKFVLTFYNTKLSTWTFEFGTDFGRGTAVYTDNAWQFSRNEDLWWNSDWNSSTVVKVEKTWDVGYHSLVVYGSEGCCDGPMEARFSYKGGEYQALTQENINNANPDPVYPLGSLWNPDSGVQLNLVDAGATGLRIPNVALEKLSIGLAWDTASADLDSAVLCANSASEIVDRVWWNNLVSADYSVESLGDARTGDGAGDDETIDVFLNTVDQAYTTLYVIISIYDETNEVFFQDVSSSSVTIYVQGVVFATYTIDPSVNNASRGATTYLLVELYRNSLDEGAWYLRPTNAYVYANPDGTPIRQADQVGLGNTIRDVGLGNYTQQTIGWTSGQTTVTLPYGGPGLQIPASGLNGLSVGLAWDAGNVDVDGSIIFASDAYKVVDRVYWNKVVSDDFSVEHQGDNRTGEGSGDDETILFDLSNVAPSTTHLYILLTIYDSNDAAFFNQVENVKVSLYIGGSTFLEYNLQPKTIRGAKNSPAYLLVQLYRNSWDEGNWWIQQVGEWLYQNSTNQINIRGATEPGVDEAIAKFSDIVVVEEVVTEEVVDVVQDQDQGNGSGQVDNEVVDDNQYGDQYDVVEEYDVVYDYDEPEPVGDDDYVPVDDNVVDDIPLETVDLSTAGEEGVRVPDSGLDGLNVGLSWDAGDTDLDSAILATNANHEVVDRVWWNNLVSADFSIQSLGDARTGDGAGDDETLQVFLNDVDASYDSLYVVISIYDSSNTIFFHNVNMSRVNIYLGGSVFATYEIDPSSNEATEGATSYILVQFYRNSNDEGAWYIRTTNVWVYANPDQTPVRLANQVGLDIAISNIGSGSIVTTTDSTEWTADEGTYTLPYGGDGLQIPDVGLGELTVGLAWDAGNTDVDGSIIFANDAHQVVDRVFWNKVVSDDQSVEHLGDNRTGEGSGDDETIAVYLSDVSAETTHLYVLLTIYDDSDSVYFNQVNNTKISLYIGGSTFMEYNLDPTQIRDSRNSPAYILVQFYRHTDGHWWIKQVGEWLFTGSNGINIRGATDYGVDEAIALLDGGAEIIAQQQEEIAAQEEPVVDEQYSDITTWDINLSEAGEEGVKIPESAYGELSVGLAWDAGNIDLDSAVLITNSSHEVVDRVWWAQLGSMDSSVQSQGDNLTGEGSGDDETINIYLNQVDAGSDSLYVVISVYDSSNTTYFHDVAMSKVTAYIGGNVYASYVIDPHSTEASRGATSYILVQFYRNSNDGGAWYLRTTNVWVYSNPDGSSVRRASAIGLDLAIAQIGQGAIATTSTSTEWTADQGTYVLPYGGDGLEIPSSGLSELTIGLAWEAGDLDLDSSIIMANTGHQVVDRVFYGKTSSDDSSIQHQGDNRTGEGSGDDETIQLNLSAVQADTTHLYVLLTIYGEQYFNYVTNTKISLYIGGATFMEYNLSPNTIREAKNSPAYLLVQLYRYEDGTWWIKQVGEWLYQNSEEVDIRNATDYGVDQAILRIEDGGFVYVEQYEEEQDEVVVEEQIEEVYTVEVQSWDTSSGETFNLSEAGEEGIRIPDIALERLSVGLAWEANDADLDSSILLANSESDVIDRVWWNNLVSADYSVESLGDARTGEGAGDDETVDIYLNTVDASSETLYIVISIYDDSDTKYFSDVSNTKVTIYVEGVIFATYEIDPHANSGARVATSYVLVQLYRNHNDGGAWYLKPTNIWVYANPDGSAVRAAHEVGLDIAIKQIGTGEVIENTSTLGWNINQESYTLPYGGDGLQIPAVGLGELTLGLAWDAGNTDVDASIILVNYDYQIVDRIFYAQTISQDQSIEHLGDNRTGEGNGDDETITFKLNQVQNDVDHLYVLLTIYDSEDSTYFSDVANVRVSLYIGGRTFMEYNLAPNTIEGAQNSPAYLLVQVYRNKYDNGNWWIQQVGQWLYQGSDGNSIRQATEYGVDEAIFRLQEGYTEVVVVEQEEEQQQVEVVEEQTTVLDLATAGADGLKIPDYALDGLSIGLAWDAGNTDLDSAVICGNASHDVVDRVWWSKLVSNDYSIESLGDNRTGEGNGDDETINFYLNNVDASYQTLYIIISIYDPSNTVFFQDVTRSQVTVYVGGSVFATYVIDPQLNNLSRDASTYLLVELYRNSNDGGAWYLRPTDVWVYKNPDNSGVRYANAQGIDIAIKSIGSGAIVNDTSNWSPDQGTITLPQGGDGLAIPASGLGELSIGLGWDAGNIDLDGNILLANSAHQVVDKIYWAKTESNDYSVMHQGDNRTGDGSGDDETIKVYLSDVSQDISHIYVLLTIYDPSDTSFFNNVANTKVTLYIGDNVFMEYNIDPTLERESRESSAYLLVQLYRNQFDNRNWWIQSVGDYLSKGPRGNNIRNAHDTGVEEAIFGMQTH